MFVVPENPKGERHSPEQLAEHHKMGAEFRTLSQTGSVAVPPQIAQAEGMYVVGKMFHKSDSDRGKVSSKEKRDDKGGETKASEGAGSLLKARLASRGTMGYA